MSMMARSAVRRYSIDWRWCQTCCGWIGNGWLPSGSCRDRMNGMLMGVGLPMISLSRPIWLWNPVVVRTPPLNQVEYDAAPALHRARLALR